MNDDTPTHVWADEVVREWIAKLDHVPTIQGWFAATHERLAALGAVPRGVSLQAGAEFTANGCTYQIASVQREMRGVIGTEREFVTVLLERQAPTRRRTRRR